jgi:ABC-type glycerol-3-phosphate transport system substrate-binding protein
VEGDDLFERMANQFNDYSLENNLNITLKINAYSISNTTNFVNQFGKTIDELLQHKSKEYDIYFYDVIYSKRYSSHFLDLNSWIPRNHLDMYTKGVALETCKYNGKWVGLPFHIDFSVLYVNRELFQKYELEYPKTWDELIEKGKFILDNERAKGNNELIGYNGLVSDNESCICSILEFIYSYRNSKDSKVFPGFDSEEAAEALNKLKEIKENLSSDQIFQSSDFETVNYLLSGNAIYIKYWNIPLGDKYDKINLPGKKEGVSGTTIGGFDVGVSKYISSNHKKNAMIVLQYFTSKEFQKNYTITERRFSGIPSLYDDDDVCAVLECDLFKQFQPISRSFVVDNYDDYDEYSLKFRTYIAKFLFGNESISKILSNIIDISKNYSVLLSTDTTKVGLIFLIISCIIIMIMILSLLFLLHPKAKYAFGFMTIDFWILTIFGCILYLGFVFAGYGDATKFKCHGKMIAQTLGFTFSLAPSFHRLVCNFPRKTHFTGWINKNRYIFILSFIVLDVLLNELLFLSSYNTKVKIIDDGKNYKICQHRSTIGYVKFAIIYLVKFIIILIFSFIIYLEWNLRRSYRDVRVLIINLIMNVMLYTILAAVNIVNYDDYILHFVFNSIVVMTISIFNYILLYVIRITWLFQDKKDMKRNTSERSKMASYISNSSNKIQISSLSVVERIKLYHNSNSIIGGKTVNGVSRANSVIHNNPSIKSSENNPIKSSSDSNPEESVHAYSFA